MSLPFDDVTVGVVNAVREIEELSGQSCGLHLTGGVMLAGTKERMDWLKMAHAKGRYLGMHTEIISAAEAKKLVKLLGRHAPLHELHANAPPKQPRWR